MTRAEHLQWCKDRANAYLAEDDIRNGITSMLSDLGEHPETQDAGSAMAMIGMLCIVTKDIDEAKRFVEGFN